MSNQYVQTQVVCANCSKERGPVNHWWLVYPPRPEVRALDILRYHEAAVLPDSLPACGSECLLRLVAKNLEKL